MTATPLPTTAFDGLLSGFRRQLDTLTPVARSVGRVAQVTGLIVEADGPAVALGEVCEIFPRDYRDGRDGTENGVVGVGVPAEVVGFRESRVLLMPLGEMTRVAPGCEVVASRFGAAAPVGPGLIGRVLDGLGRPLDGRGPLRDVENSGPLRAAPPNPLGRARIGEPFATGVRALDAFTPVGRGQRLGIFAGSGVGKSSLLGMIARGSEAEVNVIALVGERGRELREFIEKDLGPDGMARSVVVAATSDQPAPVRLRAALLATAVAESFRDQGQNVLFMMDSVTRFAMAQREIGLAVGEPPATRGYTPSCFSVLPQLLERTGAAEQGTVTAFYTVLVEGDDLNEPVADTVRGILDGHVVLSRALATANHFPAIDVLESVSRLSRDVCSPAELGTVGRARDLLALYRRNEDLINIGAYTRGSNPKIDQAIEKHEALGGFLRQPIETLVPRAEAFRTLEALLR